MLLHRFRSASKRTTFILGALAALVCTAAFAQPPFHARERGGHDGDGRIERGTELIEFLELSEAQQASWSEIHQQQREALRPLFERLHASMGEVHELLETNDPDPTEVGNLMIENRNLHRQIDAAKEGFGDKLKAVLTPEQVEKYEAFEAARAAGHRRGERKGHLH
jgi:Spy/CpxP family protein refolding chaperone